MATTKSNESVIQLADFVLFFACLTAVILGLIAIFNYQSAIGSSLWWSCLGLSIISLLWANHVRDRPDGKVWFITVIAIIIIACYVVAWQAYQLQRPILSGTILAVVTLSVAALLFDKSRALLFSFFDLLHDIISFIIWCWRFILLSMLVANCLMAMWTWLGYPSPGLTAYFIVSALPVVLILFGYAYLRIRSRRQPAGD